MMGTDWIGWGCIVFVFQGGNHGFYWKGIYRCRIVDGCIGEDGGLLVCVCAG